MRITILGLLALVIAAGSCFGQTDDASKYYKMEFVVKEVEGAKVTNSRSYSMILPVEATGRNNPGGGSIRTSSRVPISNSGTNSNNFTYYDVGVSIDCKTLHESGSGVSLQINADISTTSNEPSLPAPVTRTNRWASMVVVPIGKPAVIYTSDDATSKRQMQLELTATPVR